MAPVISIKQVKIFLFLVEVRTANGNRLQVEPERFIFANVSGRNDGIIGIPVVAEVNLHRSVKIFHAVKRKWRFICQT